MSKHKLSARPSDSLHEPPPHLFIYFLVFFNIYRRYSIMLIFGNNYML